jgi:hypothetical protein
VGTRCAIFKELAPPGRVFTHCAEAGSGQQGDTCASGADCSPGSECFLTDAVTKQCLTWCKLPGGSNCPGGSVCVPLNPPQIIGSVHYGACAPLF